MSLTTIEKSNLPVPLPMPYVAAALPELLGRIGALEVRLARNSSEIAAAQEVRFQVFYDELGAQRRYVHELEARDADRRGISFNTMSYARARSFIGSRSRLARSSSVASNGEVKGWCTATYLPATGSCSTNGKRSTQTKRSEPSSIKPLVLPRCNRNAESDALVTPG